MATLARPARFDALLGSATLVGELRSIYHNFWGYPGNFSFNSYPLNNYSRTRS